VVSSSQFHCTPVHLFTRWGVCRWKHKELNGNPLGEALGLVFLHNQVLVKQVVMWKMFVLHLLQCGHALLTSRITHVAIGNRKYVNREQQLNHKTLTIKKMKKLDLLGGSVKWFGFIG